jgi:transcription elongation GreA/GreB family factor
MNTVPQSIPLTAAFYAQTTAKYNQLLKERAEVMKRLQTAREMGDLSENGAYKYAKFELGSIGRQLQQHKFLLDHGVVVQKPPHPTTVAFGCSVTVIVTGKSHTYTIVSQYESDPKAGKLSLESPIGAALMNKKVGDTIDVAVPAGTVTYVITHIE